MSPHKITTPVFVGLTVLMVKNQNSLPDSVKKHFDLLDEKMFSHDKFTVKALFSGANHAKINYSAGVQTPIYMD